MTLTQKLEHIGTALAGAVPNTYHYWRPQMQEPFCVWAEDGEGSNHWSDNAKGEQSISGYVDYYTRTEYDPAIDAIQDVMKGITAFPFGWSLYTVDFEDDTNLIHYQWLWSMA